MQSRKTGGILLKIYKSEVKIRGSKKGSENRNYLISTPFV